jgi:enoyl-[acyl-carrier protein] reductase I
MSTNILKGKRGIIFGALDEQSIAWKVAEKAVAEGASIVLTNAPVAMRFGKIQELGIKLNAEIIPADATSMEDLQNLFSKSMEVMGGKIDFVLHSIGMSVNVRKGKAYTDLNHDWMLKTFDVSAISFHKVMQVAYKMDAISDWGSILALSYIAAQRVFPDYSEMAESKALLESYARSFGYHFGAKNKVRVNTISQSPTMTTAGQGVKGFDKFFEYAEQMSPLGNASAEACADYCVVMFSDLTRYVTMQNLFHDGGFSFMGINPILMEE